MKPRSRARALALQVLYEVDIANHLPGDVLKDRLEENPHADDIAEFARKIIAGVSPITQTLDHLISKHAPEWPLDQIATIDRNILRIALWEIALSGDTPIKVAINEAVELAKQYGSDSAPRFVNGVLGSLSDHQHEIQQTLHKA